MRNKLGNSSRSERPRFWREAFVELTNMRRCAKVDHCIYKIKLSSQPDVVLVVWSIGAVTSYL